MLKGNKGEWSELYALIYLLGTRKLFAADENLQKIEEVFFPILKILRQESPIHNLDYILSGEHVVEVYINNHMCRSMNSKEFVSEAKRLRNEILTSIGRSFEVPASSPFISKMGVGRLAAPSNDITDISMQVHDINTGYNPIMGFSIKSYLGGAPTLLNASGATNLIYKVSGIDDSQMNKINEIDSRTKIIDRIAKIKEYGGIIQFEKMANETFASNLQLIDSRMEEIIAEMLLYSYSTGVIDCMEIINYVEGDNPLNYPRKGFYGYKFKKLLCAKALGMDPSSPWDGKDDANGGYIVVKSNGEVLAYHLYNRNMFEQYLLQSTKLERASTTRHGYASLYRENGEMFIKLNLQIRFKEDT